MKKVLLLVVFMSALALTSNSQITKKNWLVGGSGKISSSKQTILSTEVKGLNVALSPNVGYFFIDKLAGGIRAQLAINRVESSGGTTRTTQVGAGPFIRYYLLDKLNQINLFADASYKYSQFSGNSGGDPNHTNTFTISAGPVIYFNSSVGLELTANYEYLDSRETQTRQTTFFLSIGFQIHLERENN